MFDAEVNGHREELQRQTTDPLPFADGHWQGDAAQGGDADGDYNQSFEVDEEHNTSTTPEKKHFKLDEVDSSEVDVEHDTSTTPEKKHFKFNEVDSPDVIPLTQFITNQPPPPRDS